jgi:hypothetical protein
VGTTKFRKKASIGRKADWRLFSLGARIPVMARAQL